jgi:ApeA N-terminal domain 1
MRERRGDKAGRIHLRDTVGARTGERSVAFEEGHARVADWEERNIHGLLSDGTPVSVVGAQGGMKRASMMSLDYRQEFTSMRHIILNEHIDDRTPFYSCRFRVTGPIWLEAEDEVAMTSDGGRLVVIRDGSECWFEFTPPEPLTIKDFGRWVLSPIATLASIITSNPADDIDLYARLRAESPWRQVHRPDESELPRARRELLSTSHLSSERFVRWIDFRKRSGALDAAAIDDFQGVSIQTEVLTLAAVAEGLHRRIFDGRKRVPAISTEDLAETRRAARGAALACLRDLDRSDRNPFTADDLAEFKRAMNDSFAFMNELTFRTRMAEIASTAKAAIPDIVTAFADWPKAVKDARNILAHQRALPYSESIDQFYDLLIALTYSIAWVLRTVLLVEAGIDAPTLQAAYRQWSQYTHHLANTRSLLAGSRYAAS